MCSLKETAIGSSPPVLGTGIGMGPVDLWLQMAYLKMEDTNTEFPEWLLNLLFCKKEDADQDKLTKSN